MSVYTARDQRRQKKNSAPSLLIPGDIKLRALSLQEKLETLDHVATLADFAMAMKKKLSDINLHSFNNFEMKVGK